MYIKRTRVRFKKRPKKKLKGDPLANLLPSEIPKSYWLKKEMQEWYAEHDIPYSITASKKDLWEGIKKVLNEKS